jgi:hypothetical protein
MEYSRKIKASLITVLDNILDRQTNKGMLDVLSVSKSNYTGDGIRRGLVAEITVLGTRIYGRKLSPRDGE